MGRVPILLGLGPAIFGRAQVLLHLSQLLLQDDQIRAVALILIERRVRDGAGEVFPSRFQLFDLGFGNRQFAFQVRYRFALFAGLAAAIFFSVSRYAVRGPCAVSATPRAEATSANTDPSLRYR